MLTTSSLDPYFRIGLISQTPNPQQTIYAALHQDYSEGFVFDEMGGDRWPTEQRAGEIALRRILRGELHAGPLEHPQIVLNVGGFPHSVMQQARTHRIASFDVQSMRYTGERIVRCAEGQLPVEEVFYLRPVGDYTDRKGHKYHYDAEWRASDLSYCLASAKHYARAIARGAAEEHARGTLAFDFRQNFIVSMNMRSLGHLLTIRGKLDAQLEIQEMCKLMLPHYEAWAPEIYGWFIERQWRKGRLSL
jgi:thymidylate synthase (FAD)